MSHKAVTDSEHVFLDQVGPSRHQLSSTITLETTALQGTWLSETDDNDIVLAHCPFEYAAGEHVVITFPRNVFIAVCSKRTGGECHFGRCDLSKSLGMEWLRFRECSFTADIFFSRDPEELATY